jgi:hypothetical protein
MASASVQNLMSRVGEMKAKIQNTRPVFPLDEFMDDASKNELTMKWHMNLFKFIATLLQAVLDSKVKSHDAAAIFMKCSEALDKLQPVVATEVVVCDNEVQA